MSEQATGSLIRGRMPELDIVRGISILLVVLYHGMAYPLHSELSTLGRVLFSASQYGWVGVNLFFVLSGFLITGILLDTKERPDYFRRFYFRRALRILPALYGLLIVLLIGRWIPLPFAAISVLFLANFGGILGVGLRYGVLWSLAVEEHFYALWPLLVRRFSTRSLMMLAAAVAIVSPLLRTILLVGPGDPEHCASLFSWFNLDGLSLGAFLAIWLREPSFRRQQLQQVAFPVFVLSCIGFSLLTGHAWAEATLVETACNLAAAGFLSCMLLIGSSRRKFDVPVLKFFGFISYGLYLVHVLAFHIVDVSFAKQFATTIAAGYPTLAMMLRFSGGLALATVLAYLSRRSLEETFLSLAHRGPTISLELRQSKAPEPVMPVGS